MGKRAIVIGVGRSDLTTELLPSAERDADRFRRLLSGEINGVELAPDELWSIYSVIASDEIDQMTGKRVGSAGHLANVFDSWWYSTLDEDQDDLHLLIYFAGHANRVPSGDVELMATDAGWIGISDLAQKMVDSKARNVTVILDSCFAGALQEELLSKLLVPGASHRGRAVFAACATDARSYSAGEMGGFFTTVVMRGLSGEAAADEVTAAALVSYVSANWSRVLPDYASRQTPVLLVSPAIPRDIPIVKIARRRSAPDSHQIVSPETTRSPAVAVSGPLGNIRAERTGDGARIYGVARVTGELHLWPVAVHLAASERLLAVTLSFDRSTAWLVVSDGGAAQVVRVRERDGVQRYSFDRVHGVAWARFGTEREGDRDTVVFGTADGAEYRVRVWMLLPSVGARRLHE